MAKQDSANRANDNFASEVIRTAIPLAQGLLFRIELSQQRQLLERERRELLRQQGQPVPPLPLEEARTVEIPPFDELVRLATWQVLSQLGDRKPARKAIDQFVEMRDESNKYSGVFRADILSVRRDNHTQRHIVTYSDPRENSQYETEEIKTQPDYTAEGRTVSSLAYSLIGHRVALYKYGDSFEDKSGKTSVSKRSKTLIHLEDLGLTSDHKARSQRFSNIQPQVTQQSWNGGQQPQITQQQPQQQQWNGGQSW